MTVLLAVDMRTYVGEVGAGTQFTLFSTREDAEAARQLLRDLGHTRSARVLVNGVELAEGEQQ